MFRPGFGFNRHSLVAVMNWLGVNRQAFERKQPSLVDVMIALLDLSFEV